MPRTVRQLARLSGVSIRTLHHYDETGLLRPASRSAAGYRLYGERELLRLQQILFYRALGLPLRDIAGLLQASDTDTLQALEGHRRTLLERQDSLVALLATVDNTIARLKGEQPMNDKDLYAGFPEDVRNLRDEAVELYGSAQVEHSERALRKLSARALQALLQELQDVTAALAASQTLAPDDDAVQSLVERHYGVIRRLWGTSAESDPQAQAYAGLGQLYVDDERFLSDRGQSRSAFASFLCAAMAHYSRTRLA